MSTQFPPIRAIIFDVDGTLINSEDIYTDIYNNILREYGKPELPWCIKAMQQSRGRDGTLRMLKWAGLENELSVEEWKAKGKIHTHLFKNSALLPGVEELLRKLKTVRDVKLAIASSASRSIFGLKTSHLPIIVETFGDTSADGDGNEDGGGNGSADTSVKKAKSICVFGDDPEMSDARKKPAPDVFLLALKRINQSLGCSLHPHSPRVGKDIRPEECLVFEDSIAGVEAARRAGMRVVWVPHPGLAAVCWGREGDVLAGRAGVVDWEIEGAVVGDSGEVVEEGRVYGGRVVSEDGWAVMVRSLEGFELGEYGIEVQSGSKFV